MRVLILHSDVAEDASPDDLDTLDSVDSVEGALRVLGYAPSRAPFRNDYDQLATLIEEHAPDVVFNLVEAVDGLGSRAGIAPRMLDDLGIPFTGSDAVTLALTSDKPLSKRKLRSAGLPTPQWAEPPDWLEVDIDRTYIVKSATEDASVGLDAGAVLRGFNAIRDRADMCSRRFGGRWFAEAFVEGREFNVSVISDGSSPKVLPLAEMTFLDWKPGVPRIVGYDAKWTEDSYEYNQTIRRFVAEGEDLFLAERLRDLAAQAFSLFEIDSYARVDFRVDAAGVPYVIEINPNPCIAPDSGLAAAAEMAGISYAHLVERIVLSAVRASVTSPSGRLEIGRAKRGEFRGGD